MLNTGTDGWTHALPPQLLGGTVTQRINRHLIFYLADQLKPNILQIMYDNLFDSTLGIVRQ